MKNELDFDVGNSRKYDPKFENKIKELARMKAYGKETRARNKSFNGTGSKRDPSKVYGNWCRGLRGEAMYSSYRKERYGEDNAPNFDVLSDNDDKGKDFILLDGTIIWVSSIPHYSKILFIPTEEKYFKACKANKIILVRQDDNFNHEIFEISVSDFKKNKKFGGKDRFIPSLLNPTISIPNINGNENRFLDVDNYYVTVAEMKNITNYLCDQS